MQIIQTFTKTETILLQNEITLSAGEQPTSFIVQRSLAILNAFF